MAEPPTEPWEEVQSPRERDLRWVFDVVLAVKAFDGVVEVLAGMFVAAVRPAFIAGWMARLAGDELAREPSGLTARTVHLLAHTLAAGGHWLVALYLVLHGLIKVLLVIGIFSGKRIAYPLFMAALVIFGIYEIYRGVGRHEVFLEALAALDFIILILTVHEYRVRYGESILKLFR